MRSPTCIVSTLRRWRLFRPWIVNPCSRVLRKLSGELTIIQNWEARPSVRPDFRLRRGRPDLAGLSPVGAAGGSGVSDTTEIVLLTLTTGAGWGPALVARAAGPSGSGSGRCGRSRGAPPSGRPPAG